MDSQHRLSIASCLIAVSTAAFLATCMAISSCDAADHSASSAQSAHRRDLINRPDCWNREHSEDWYLCVAGLR